MKRSVWITCVLFVAAGAAVAFAMRRGEVVVTEKRLDTLPRTLDGRVGTDDQFDDGVYKVLNADQNFLRRYDRPGGKDVLWLYIGYYGTQKGGRTGHMPQYCYPGSGWDITEMSKVEVKNFDGTLVPLNKIVVSKGDTKTIALYWNHTAGNRVLDSGFKMNVNRFLRRVRENRDDGAFVRISGVVQGDDAQKCLDEEKRLAEELLKALPGSWPIEKEI